MPAEKKYGSCWGYSRPRVRVGLQLSKPRCLRKDPFPGHWVRISWALVGARCTWKNQPLPLPTFPLYLSPRTPDLHTSLLAWMELGARGGPREGLWKDLPQGLTRTVGPPTSQSYSQGPSVSTVLVTRTWSMSLSSHPEPTSRSTVYTSILLGQSLIHRLTLLFYNWTQIFSEHAQGIWLMLTGTLPRIGLCPLVSVK